MALRIFLLALMLHLGSGHSLAQSEDTARTYADGRGGEIRLPLGDLSFADDVVAFRRGDPSAADEHSRPQEALASPDYDTSIDDRYLTLGCRGELIVRFTDNALAWIPTARYFANDSA